MKKKSKQITLVLVCALGLGACSESPSNRSSQDANSANANNPYGQDSHRRSSVHYAPAVYSPGYYSSPMFYMVPMVLSLNAMRSYRRYQPYSYSAGSYRGSGVSNNTPGGGTRGYATNDPNRLARAPKPTADPAANKSKGGVFGWFRGSSSSSSSSSSPSYSGSSSSSNSGSTSRGGFGSRGSSSSS
jgi:hypothetical protein